MQLLQEDRTISRIMLYLPLAWKNLSRPKNCQARLLKVAKDISQFKLTQTSPEMGWAHSEAAGRSGGAGAAAERDCWEGEGA